MDIKNIQLLLSRFFEKDHPKETRKKFATWFIEDKQTEEKEWALQEIWNSLPETTDLSSIKELQRVNKRIQSKSIPLYRRLAVVAAIFLLPLCGAISMYLYVDSQTTPKEIKLVECFVPNGERKQLTLADGSTVWLNAGSILLYPEEFNADTRTLFLSGEANFTVAKDAQRPFIVKTNYLDIEALGTVFNVNAYPDSENTIAILKSGKIRVDDKSGICPSVILHPNEELVFNHASNSFKKENVDAERVTGWTEGYLIFHRESLDNIFRAMERRYNVKINYNDSKFSAMTFTVRFHAEETLEEALIILKQIGVNFQYKIVDNDVFIK